MKVLLDMNMSPRLVPMLTDAGFAAVAWSSLGAANDLDPKIMLYAVDHDYVVLTNDLDFGLMLSATNASTPSVVQVRLDNLDPELIGGRLIEVLRTFGADLEAGALVTVDPKKTRVRVLPLGPRE
jgi:predicted nuclease of predicted toxin-antitoxin system